jgi:nitrite reductase (NADH) small subunit
MSSHEGPAETTAMAGRTPVTVCRTSDVAPGQRLVLTVRGKSIGVFNIDGSFYALHNRCPHAGGALCLGPLTGTTLPTDQREYIYALEGQILRCAWHGWEFEVKTGRCLVNARMRARMYPVTVSGDQVVVHI